MAEGVNDAKPEDLKPPLGLSCAAGPEISKTRSMPARLAYITRIDGQCLYADAALEVALGHLEVERHRVNAAFLEVAAIGLLVMAAEGGKLCEISFLHYHIKN